MLGTDSGAGAARNRRLERAHPACGLRLLGAWCCGGLPTASARGGGAVLGGDSRRRRVFCRSRAGCENCRSRCLLPPSKARASALWVLDIPWLSTVVSPCGLVSLCVFALALSPPCYSLKAPAQSFHRKHRNFRGRMCWRNRVSGPRGTDFLGAGCSAWQGAPFRLPGQGGERSHKAN